MKHEFKQVLKDYYITNKGDGGFQEKHFRENIQLYASHLPKKAFGGKLVLEAGCGSGVMGDWLEKNWGAAVIGVDLSQPVLSDAKKRYSPHFLQTDLEMLSLKNDTFDTVLLYDVLEHIVYPQAMFKEFYRVLKKGGYLIIVSSNLIFDQRVPFNIKMLETFDYLRSSSEFRYIRPLIDQTIRGRRDSTLITNPVKVMRVLRWAGFSLIKKSYMHCNIIAKK